MTGPTPPAIVRADVLLGRIIATLARLAPRGKVTLKGSELRLLLDAVTEAREEIRSVGKP